MEIEHKGSAILILVEQCCKNDPKAQMELYRMFSHGMFSTSLRIVGDRLLAEDVMQESFLTAFDKIKECKTPGYFGSWLKRIVINKSIDEIRKKRMSFAPLEDNLAFEEESEAFLNEEEVEATQLLEYVKKAITLLPDGYRVVLTLKLIEDFEYSEIAKRLSLKESTVRSQYVRGRQKLLEIVEELKKKKHD
ncbi:MAG TPA: RNA polymerase sigma factor [Bacteroidales bacterium]|nr:RNA polymerase sigma factor [Bacteroidales bacterium]